METWQSDKLDNDKEEKFETVKKGKYEDHRLGKEKQAG